MSNVQVTGPFQVIRRRKSLLRSEDYQRARRDIDKRPAGPSKYSDPGMGSPTTPLPPGTVADGNQGLVRHPKVAGNFRPDQS
jgi:hypothetical protein